MLPIRPFTKRLRARQLQILSRRWQRGALFVLGGIAVGAAAVGLALAADWVSALFHAVLAWQPLIALAVTPLGFAVSTWVARRYFPNSGGSGIPQAIAARQLQGLAAREQLVSLRMALGKMVLLLLGLLCGASVGREGPTVQVGASVMFAVGRLSPRRQPGLILAGASAGVSAAFNTPLAGIVFGIEEMSRSFETRTSGIIIGGIVAAGLTSLALQGNYTYFGTTHVMLGGSAEAWLAVPILGLLGGLLGGGFSRTLILFGGNMPGRLGGAIMRHPVLFSAVCGLIVAVCGLLSGGAAFGTGYTQARALVQGQGGTPATFCVLKLLATTASSISGIPGGLFAPSLAVGAGLGANVAALLPGAPTQALVVLGMVAYFSGVVQAPITAFVIVTEMTNDHALVVPLMLTSLIGYAASRLICPEGVYHALAHNFVAAAEADPQGVLRTTPAPSA
ncbi:MAG: chloride channel protein [Pseudomonadota bacterium]|nr:chloride channel protein [Pseudomonadota bacterium]